MDGTAGFTVLIWIRRDGAQVYQESQVFDREPAAQIRAIAPGRGRHTGVCPVAITARWLDKLELCDEIE